MEERSTELLKTHISELRKIAAILAERGSKFQIERSKELTSRADSAEVYMILNKKGYDVS